jgi:hypothetical protein
MVGLNGKRILKASVGAFESATFEEEAASEHPIAELEPVGSHTHGVIMHRDAWDRSR